MTGTSLVATTTFHSQTGHEYVFPKHDVLIAAGIHNAWAKRMKGRIYPVRVQMANANWALFRAFYPQFHASSDRDVAWVSEDLAEEGVIHAAMKRVEDPVWVENFSKGLKDFCEHLSHEPVREPFHERHPQLFSSGL